MKAFTPRTIQLKNGASVLIRQAEIADAEKLLNCLKTYIPQSEYIPKLEQEIKLTVSDEENWIRSFSESNNSLLLIAEHEHQIIGNIDLTGSRREMMVHTAVIGMGMLNEWRNSGLGTALLSATIEWAQQNPVLELIWLQVYTQNQLGISLYKKMGFEENGIIKDFFKNKNGYFDNLTMTLKVN